tara:strand:+ start:1600 stop:1941 length:342 start_codon:yes stop_codon:yes gene_type:complete
MTSNLINITLLAGKKLQGIASRHNTNSILFYIKGGGCNGFGYNLQPIDHTSIDPLDEIVKYKDINIVVCKDSIFHLLGTTIDFKKDLMGECFHFENPNATSQCGCGTSFSVNN